MVQGHQLQMPVTHRRLSAMRDACTATSPIFTGVGMRGKRKSRLPLQHDQLRQQLPVFHRSLSAERCLHHDP
jgi:hypothetical protein